MRRLLYLCMLLPAAGFSQSRLHLNLFGGFSNYYGDLQDKTFTMSQGNGAFGVGVQYDLTNHFSVLSNFTYGKIEADDKRNKPILQARNLSFETKIVELNVLGQYILLDLNEHRFSPYVFAGVAVYHFNPYAFDSLGNQVFLKPLSTEGEGLAAYPDRKPYSLTQFAVPFGAGLKLRVSDNVVLGYEIGFRKLFTDYLDDVSTSYVDQFTLFSAKGPKAVEMAYRGGEVKGGDPTYPTDGTVRGGSKYKDWYYFSGITVSIGLGNGSGGGRNRLGCPTKVY